LSFHLTAESVFHVLINQRHVL